MREDEDEDKRMEEYFEEYFHPTQNVNAFLQELSFAEEAPKQRTLTRLNVAYDRLMSRNVSVAENLLRSHSEND